MLVGVADLKKTLADPERAPNGVPWKGARALRLRATVADLHRWLLALHGRYVKAEWALQCWPEWFEGTDPKSAARITVLH